jgi:integrating conjugative element protein (TIGR03756 family)
MKRHQPIVFLSLALTLNGAKAFDVGVAPIGKDVYDTSQLVKAAVCPDCIQVAPAGICFFLVCTPFGCDIETSLRIGHYNPDVVVSAYNGLTHARDRDPISGFLLGGMPWKEMRAVLSDVELEVGSVALKVLGQVPKSLASGGTAAVGATPAMAVKEQAAHTDFMFREVNIVGNPVASVVGSVGGMACPSEVTAFRPYYLSSLDAVAWRWQIPEIVYPQSWVPGWREVAESWPLNTWGQIYPRSGFGTQTDPVKQAAVAAQRAADVTTRRGQPHIYTVLGSGSDRYRYTHQSNQEVWTPGALKEDSVHFGRWQMVSPKLGKHCTLFGRNDTISVTGWGGGKVAGNGSYSWILWRPYQCCETKGAFIGTLPPPDTSYPPKGLPKYPAAD